MMERELADLSARFEQLTGQFRQQQEQLQRSAELMAEAERMLFEARERYVQAEDQLERLGHKRGCIGGCGFEDLTLHADHTLYRLWHDLFPPDPANKPYVGDIVSEIDISAEQVRLGVAGLRAQLQAYQDLIRRFAELGGASNDHVTCTETRRILENIQNDYPCLEEKNHERQADM